MTGYEKPLTLSKSFSDPEASDSKMSSGNIAGGKNTLKQGRRKKSRFEDRPPPSDVKGVSETGSVSVAGHVSDCQESSFIWP